MADDVVRAFTDFESAVAFVEGHHEYFNEQVDGVVETFQEWRGFAAYGDVPGGAKLEYSLSIVCPGHYAFEKDGDSIEALFLEAGAAYAEPKYAYDGGCGCRGDA